MNLEEYDVELPEGCNVILGQTHFIKSVEDIYEAMVGSSGATKFGLAFSEASGPCLVRVDGNDSELKNQAAKTLMDIGCGHTFIIFLKNSFPINFLGAIRAVPEVCHIIAATANPLKLIIARTEQGGGIMGVVDGFPPKGMETEKDVEARKKFLRDIGYKR
jgi:adenosine/AMP kinase